MNKTSFRVTIPEPCHENWDAMTPREKGRFCDVCTKTVVDFSVMGDAELFETIKNGNGKICGHFHKDQLDRTINQPVKPKIWLQPFWKYFVGLFLFFKPATSKAQGKPVCVPVTQDVGARKVGIIATVPHAVSTREISGKVINNQQQPLAGVIVGIKGVNKYVPTNQDGEFKIKARTGDILEFNDLQYQTTQYRIGKAQNITITLEEKERQYFEGKVVIAPPVQQQAAPIALQVTVTDKATGKPVSDALVTWNENGKVQNYRLENTNRKGIMKTKTLCDAPEILFTVSALGYNTANTTYIIKKNEKTVQLEVQLEKAAPVLELMGAIMVLPTKQEEVKKTELPVQGKAPGLTLFPNPATKNTSVTLQCNSEKAGTMMAQMLNSEGKIILNQRFEALPGENQVPLKLPANTASGIYTIRVMNSEGQWIAAEQLVVN